MTAVKPDSKVESLRSEQRGVRGTGMAITRQVLWLALTVLVLLSLAASWHMLNGRVTAALLDSEAVQAAPVSAPVPNTMPLSPLQRCGFVAFRLSGIDVAALNGGFSKLEHRVPKSWERNLGLDFCTVLLEDTRTFELPDAQTYYAEIEQMITETPGHLWFIGNEPENPCRFGTHSGEYAQRYHKLYYFIKERDPTAQVGIGGVVLPSELRRKWLENVLDAYQGRYGEPMPVDVWNIHNLLLSECPGECGCPTDGPCDDLCCSGGYVPPELWCQKGWYFSQDDQAKRVDVFEELIWEFRRWMATREEARDKPLIVTEMGVFAWYKEAGGRIPHEWINQFMYETFDFLMNATDPEIGYPADDYHLVQRWSWFKLRARGPTGKGANGSLFDLDGQITDFGLNFANYTARFLPTSPTTIFFQKGWTGYTEDPDTTLGQGESRPNANSLWIATDRTQKALLKFDLSILPTNVEVVSATLSLRSGVQQGVSNMTVDCYGVNRLWSVGEATWTNATATTSWEEPGCSGPSDREMAPASSAEVVATGTIYTWDVSALARRWVADPGANHGVVLEAAEGSAGGSGYWTFLSSNQAEETRPGAEWTYRERPKLELVVRLTEPTPTPTATQLPTETPTATATCTPTVPSYTIHLPIILKKG